MFNRNSIEQYTEELVENIFKEFEHRKKTLFTSWCSVEVPNNLNALHIQLKPSSKKERDKNNVIDLSPDVFFCKIESF